MTATTIQLRRDTAANWTAADPILAAGEAGVETDTSKLKIGDGVTAWSALAYLTGESAGGTAESTTYDNGTSGLDATDVQAAIDELAAEGGGGGGSTVPDPRWSVGPGETSVDEFDDGALDPAYVRVDPTGNAGHLTWTESRGVLSAAHITGASDSNEGTHHALLLPLSEAGGALAAGDGFVTSQRVYMQNMGYNVSCGLMLANGTVFGAGEQLICRRYAHSGTAYRDRLEIQRITGFNTHVSVTGAEPATAVRTAVIHQRLVYLGGNLWRLDESIDGVTWIKDANTLNYAFVPTHVGFALSGVTTPIAHTASWDYLRRVSGVS